MFDLQVTTDWNDSLAARISSAIARLPGLRPPAAQRDSYSEQENGSYGDCAPKEQYVPLPCDDRQEAQPTRSHDQ